MDVEAPDDDLGSTIEVSTNCVGNFWVTPGAYDPAFPILVKVFAEGGGGFGVVEPPSEAQWLRWCATCESAAAM